MDDLYENNVKNNNDMVNVTNISNIYIYIYIYIYTFIISII